MIHNEILDWMISGWGYLPVLTDSIKNAYVDRHKMPMYIKFLRDLKKRMSTNINDYSGVLPNSIKTMLEYSHFTPFQKNKLLSSYISNMT